MAAHLTVNVKLRVSEEVAAELERLAKENDRTVAAEIRRAIRQYLQAAREAGVAA